MDREQHLNWAKRRAFTYLDRGYCMDAYSCFLVCLAKHPETKITTIQGEEFSRRLLAGEFGDPDRLRQFIEEFN